MSTTIKSKNPIFPKFFNFLNNEYLNDCFIIADGHIMGAHKIILAASSPYFEEIFSALPENHHPAIILNDITNTHLTKLMEFFYCGTVDIKPSDLPKFNKILKNLRIESKIEEIEEITVKVEAPDEESVINKQEENEEEEINFSEDSDYNEFKPQIERKKIRNRSPHNLTQKPKRIKIDDVVKDPQYKVLFDLKPEFCPFCGKHSKTKKHRNEHVKYCTENPDRFDSKCPYCDKSFCDPYYVRKHVKLVHKIGVDGAGEENLTSNSVSEIFKFEGECSGRGGGEGNATL